MAYSATSHHKTPSEIEPVAARAKISGTESTPDEVRINYLTYTPPSTSLKGTILLIHGFPETSYQFRHVAGPLAALGYRVVVPDTRGAGQSTHPEGPGALYTKKAMAADLHALLRENMGIKEPVHVVGHDIGGMVAHAYAASFPADTASVAWGECPLPGTKAYEETKHDPGLWHFTFHWQNDLPELLVAGRERQYIRHFYDRLCYNTRFLTTEDLQVYDDAFSFPGAMRAGFETYRAFHRDAEENLEMLEKDGKCKVPALALNGDHSLLKEMAKSMFEQTYQDFKVAEIEHSGHWCAEENPKDFVEKVGNWIESQTKQ